MSFYGPFPLTEANPTTFFANTSTSHPAMPHYPAYFNSDVVSTPISPFAPPYYPPSHDSRPLSSVDCTPPLLSTTMDVSDASASVPLLSMGTAASSGSSSQLQSYHPLYVTQPSCISSSTPSHFVPYFPEVVVSPHNPHARSPHPFPQVSYSQCNPEAWGAVSSSSTSQHKADTVGAHSYDHHLTPSYPHLQNSAYFWNTLRADCHSYVPPFHNSNLAAAQDQSKDSQHQGFVSPHMSSDQVFTQSVDYGKDFPVEEWSNDNGQAERIIGRDDKNGKMHFGLNDCERGYHQQGHITEDPAWWWTYSAVANSNAVTDVQCNPGLGWNGKGYTHSSLVGETHLAKPQHTFSLKQAASVLADMLAKPVTNATVAPDLVLSDLNVSGTEVQTPYSGSYLKDSGDITQQNKDHSLGDALNSSGRQPFSVPIASLEQFSQPENLLATTSCWPSTCDFDILSDMMKSKLHLDFMKQKVSETSLSKTREMTGSLPDLMEDRPVMAGSHDNVPLLEMDREVGTGNDKHAVVHQGVSSSGMLKVQHESAAVNSFPCHEVNAVFEDEIATGAVKNFFADDKAGSNVGHATSEGASELRSSRVNNVQIEQGVDHIEERFKKNQSVWESSKDLEHGSSEARPFTGHVDPSNDGCEAKSSVFNFCNETFLGHQGSIASSVNTKEFHSEGTRTTKCEYINKIGFSPYSGVIDMYSEIPLPYPKQCHSPDHIDQYSTVQAAKSSSFCLVGDSILNLSEVLLAHGHANNAADSSDLHNLQLSIRNLSQYLLLEKGNITPTNFASSSKFCGKQGTAQDEISSAGTKEESRNQGKREGINHCCRKLYDQTLIPTCLESKTPLQINSCNNWGNLRQCHLADPNQVEIYDLEKTQQLMDAGVALKDEGNGAPEIKLESEEGIYFHDLGTFSQKPCSGSEAQLQRMKALIDCVRRNAKNSDVAESNIVGLTCNKDKNVEAYKELGIPCETLFWDDLQNFNLGLRAEFEKLRGLLGNLNRQLAHDQWKDTGNSRELNRSINDHMPRTTKETHKADGTTLAEVRNMNEAELEEEFGTAGRQTYAVSEINLVSEPASKLHEGCQLDDTIRRVNAQCQHRLADFEVETLPSSYQDESISVYSKQDESIADPLDHSNVIPNFDSHELSFEERHILDIMDAGQIPTGVSQHPKPDKAVIDTPLYPDTEQVESRLALLKARPGWYESCSDSRSTVNTDYASIPNEPSSNTLYEPRTLLIKENYLGNPQKRSSEPDSLVDFSWISTQEFYFPEGIVCESGEKEETIHKLDYGPHHKASKASSGHSRQICSDQVDKEEIIFKPKQSSQSPPELEDAGWEKVQVASLDIKNSK